MYNQKLCLGLNRQFCPDIKKQLEIIKNTGFEAVFMSPEFAEFIPFAKSLGLEIQSLHAPFGGCADLWEDDEAEAEKAENQIVSCIELAAENDIPVVVSHAWIGFEYDTVPNEKGIERYSRIVDAAVEKGVKIAFENTEGEEFLSALMKRFENNPSVGFCWDTGHEMCYNFSADMPGRFSGRLFATHINDNLGIKDANGKIYWTDDIHLLPFDGTGNWESIVSRLKREDFQGPLTFELNRASKPGRHENDVYLRLSDEEYIAEAYKRACRVAALFRNAKP